MRHSEKLSFGEFLRDIQLVITSPGRRFALIQERGALWGSLVLLLLPAYLAFHYVGGLYFAREPFPGYYFIPPIFAAIAATLLKLGAIHVSTRFFKKKVQDGQARGRFTDLIVVFGYTGVPSILAILLATTIFLLIPQEVGRLMWQVKAVGISIMVAVAIALFVWNLILIVLALRTVYPIRDIQIVGAFILGTVLMSIPALGTLWVVAMPHIDFVCMQPILSNRILRFFTIDPTSNISPNTKISVHVDKLAYRLREPERFELVVFSVAHLKRQEKAGQGSVLVGTDAGMAASVQWQDGDYVAGRIVGLPGDTVELINGSLRIDGQSWDERYLVPEYRSNASLPMKTLGPGEYYVLPENRTLLADLQQELVVRRDQILGREMLGKWPLGWWAFRPTVFLRPQPLR